MPAATRSTMSARTAPRPMTRAERRLVAALRARDERALADVHAQFGATVFGFLVARLRDRAAAEDVFQQVLTEVWRRGPEYDPERGSLAAWILTIARSRVVDELRRRRPEPVDPAELPGDHADDSALDAAVERWRMAHLLAQLPPEERLLLELRFYAGLSQTEIGERTGVPLGSVKTRMVRGLERLRAMIDAEEDLQR